MASEWSLPLDTPSDEIEDNSLNDLLHVNTSAQSLRLINEGSASHKIGSHGDENDVVLMNVDEVLQGSLHVSGPIPERLSALSRRQGTSQQRPQPSVSIAASSSSRRKSERSVRLKRSFSPTPDTGKGNKRGPKKRKTRKSMPTQPQAENRLFDIGPDGKPFACELCQSPYICKPTRSSWRRKSQTKPKNKIPRYGYDEAKGRFLTLCNGCGIAVARRGYPKPPKVIPQTNDKEKYLEEAKQFSHNLALRLGDEDAQRLACPHFVVSKNQACGCLQRYILSEGDIEDIVHVRATHLLKLLKEAKALSTEKCYNIEEVTSKKGRQIGLGNGQKKSKRFQEFVLRNRKVLRDEFKLCERAAQRVLMYSNNFIHKKLKTEESRCRVQRIKGKAVMGLLTPIEQIPKETCCLENCIMMAVTHGRLLQEWRERVTMGQQEAKRVLAEMLTPSGGGRTNCYQFIYLVTGCSMGTISKVNDHLRRTFGDRSPPDHGLKKYWLEKGKVLEGQEPEPQVSQPIETEEEEQQRDDTLSEEMPPAQLDQGVYTEIPAIDLPHTQTSESELATSSTEVIDFISSSPTKQSDPPESVMRHQLLQFHQQLLVQQANLQRQQHMIDRQLQHILTEKQTAADRQARDRSLTSNPMLTSDPRAASRPASQSLGISGPRTLLINQQGRIHPKPGEINPLKAGTFPAPGQDAHDSDDGIIRGPESMEIDDSSQDGGDSSGPWQRVNVKHSQSLLSLLTSPPKSDPMLGATHAKSQVKSSLKTSSSDPVISALVEHAPQHKKQSARPPPQQPEQPLQQRQLQPQQQQQSQQLLLQSQPQQQAQHQLLQPPPQQQLSQQQLLQPPQQLLQPQQQQLGEPPTGSEVQVTSQAPAAQYHTITTPSGTNELIQIINPHQTHVVDSSQGLTITDITLPVLEEGSVVSIPPMTSILNTGRYPLHGNVMLLQEPMYQTDVTTDGLTTLTLNTHHQGNVAPLSTHLHGNTTQSSNQTGNKPAVTNAGNSTAQTVTSIGGVFEVAPNVTITRDLKMQQTIGQQAKTSSLKTRGAQRIVSATPSTSQPHHVQGQHQPNNKVTSNVRSQQQLARKTTSQTRHPRSKAATQAKQHQPFVVKQSTLTKTSPAVAPEISVPNVTLTAPPGVTVSKQTPSVVNVSNIIQQILNVSAGGAPRQTTLIHLSPSEASNVIAQLSNIASNSSNTSGAK